MPTFRLNGQTLAHHKLATLALLGALVVAFAAVTVAPPYLRSRQGYDDGGVGPAAVFTATNPALQVSGDPTCASGWVETFTLPLVDTSSAHHSLGELLQEVVSSQVCVRNVAAGETGWSLTAGIEGATRSVVALRMWALYPDQNTTCGVGLRRDGGDNGPLAVIAGIPGPTPNVAAVWPGVRAGSVQAGTPVLTIPADGRTHVNGGSYQKLCLSLGLAGDAPVPAEGAPLRVTLRLAAP